MISQCLNCTSEITTIRTGTTKTGAPAYRKFCNNSCAASYNNRIFPKRKVEGTCRICSTPCPASLIHCTQCKPNRPHDWSTVTLSQLRGRATYQKSAQVRTHARKVMKALNIPKECVKCGYNIHVEVSHIKPINQYDIDTRVAIINAPDNLEYLCPNHHWEHEYSVKH